MFGKLSTAAGTGDIGNRRGTPMLIVRALEIAAEELKRKIDELLSQD